MNNKIRLNKGIRVNNKIKKLRLNKNARLNKGIMPDKNVKFNSKLRLCTILIVFIAVAMYLSAIAFSVEDAEAPEEFNADDPATWDYNSPQVYQQIDPDDSRFDWSQAQYSMVSWSRVDNFERVDIRKIPDAAWDIIDQSRITGIKVGEIPAAYFDPKQITKQNLRYALEEQIAAHLSEFDNLRDANPAEVAKVFAKDPYNADVDVTEATLLRFDSGRLFTALTDFDPRDHPKDKFKILIVGNEVQFIPLTAPENIVAIEGAAIGYADGSYSLIPTEGAKTIVEGIAQGSVQLPDNLLVRFENNGILTFNPDGSIQGEDSAVTFEKNGAVQKIVDGKFRIIGNVIAMESFDGKQSHFDDKESDIQVNSVGYPLVISADGATIPPGMADISNIVAYGKDTLQTKGSVEIFKQDLHVFSKSDSAIFRLQDSTAFSYGKIAVEDITMSYEGFTDTAQFLRRSEGINEWISINGIEEGKIAEFSRKVRVGGLGLQRGLELMDVDRGIDLTVLNENGQLKLAFDPNSLLWTADVERNPTRFVFVDKNILLEVGEGDASFSISTNFGMQYSPRDGNPVTFLSPRSTQLYLGEEEIPIMLANAIVASRNQFSPKGYVAGDSVFVKLNGRRINANIVSVDGGRILLDTNNDGEADKEIMGDESILSGVSENELSNRLEIYARKPAEASALLEEYEVEHMGERVAAEANLINSYLSKEFNLPYTSIRTDIISLETPGGEPLYYKIGIVDGREVVTGWSTDKLTWLDLETRSAVLWFGQTAINKEIIWDLARAGGDFNVLLQKARENPDYKLIGTPVETRKYDEWYTAFKSKYSQYSDLVQQGGFNVANSYVRENQLDNALRFYQEVVRLDPNSQFGENAERNIGLIQTQQSLEMARMFATQEYFQNWNRYARPSSVAEGMEFYDQLIHQGFFARGMAGLDSISPWNVVRDIGREERESAIQENLIIKGNAFNMVERLIQEGYASDLKEAKAIIERASAGEARYDVGDTVDVGGIGGYSTTVSEQIIIDGKWFYRVGSNIVDLEGHIHTAQILSIEDMFMYPGKSLMENPRQFNVGRNEKLFIRNEDGTLVETDAWRLEGAALMGSAARPQRSLEEVRELLLHEQELEQKVRAAQEAGVFSRIKPEYHAYVLQNDPSIQLGIQMLDIPIDDPMRDALLLQMAQTYREKQNFEGAAWVAKDLSQTSDDPDIRVRASRLYNDIVDPNGEWFNFADESLHESTLYGIVASVANPFAWVTYGAAGKGAGMLISKLPGGTTLLSTTGRALNLPAGLIAGSSNSALRGLTGQIVRIGVEETAEAVAGVIYPPAEFVVMGLTGGADAIDQAQMAAKNAFRNARVRVDSRVHVDPAVTKLSQVLRYDGEIDIPTLRTLGSVQVQGDSLLFTNPNTGESLLFVKTGTEPSSFGGDFVEAHAIRDSVQANGRLEDAMLSLQDNQALDASLRTEARRDTLTGLPTQEAAWDYVKREGSSRGARLSVITFSQGRPQGLVEFEKGVLGIINDAPALGHEVGNSFKRMQAAEFQRLAQEFSERYGMDIRVHDLGTKEISFKVLSEGEIPSQMYAELSERAQEISGKIVQELGLESGAGITNYDYRMGVSSHQLSERMSDLDLERIVKGTEYDAILASVRSEQAGTPVTIGSENGRYTPELRSWINQRISEGDFASLNEYILPRPTLDVDPNTGLVSYSRIKSAIETGTFEGAIVGGREELFGYEVSATREGGFFSGDYDRFGQTSESLGSQQVEEAFGAGQRPGWDVDIGSSADRILIDGGKIAKAVVEFPGSRMSLDERLDLARKSIREMTGNSVTFTYAPLHIDGIDPNIPRTHLLQLTDKLTNLAKENGYRDSLVRVVRADSEGLHLVIRRGEEPPIEAIVRNFDSDNVLASHQWTLSREPVPTGIWIEEPSAP